MLPLSQRKFTLQILILKGLKMKTSRALKIMTILGYILLTSCSSETKEVKVVQDWHPAINDQLTNLNTNNILTFGKSDKEDGRYCYVSYEGLLRSEDELKQTQEVLKKISQEISHLLKTDFAHSTLEISKKNKVESIDKLSVEDLNYLNKKSELECLKVLAERQIAKYSKRVTDNRVSLK